MLDAAAIARLRAVLKPRRERYSLAFVMERWAELAQSAEPLPAAPIADEDELIYMLVEPGPAMRNRLRKRRMRPGTEIKAKFNETQRTRAAGAAQVEGHKRRKVARAGRPRADIRREGLLFLGLIYREFRKAVPVLSQSKATAFWSFAEQSFKEIGQTSPTMKPAEFERLFKTPDKRKFNREAGMKFLWGALSGDADPTAIMHRNVERERADRLADPRKYAEQAAKLSQERARRTNYSRKLMDQGKI